MIRLSKYHLKMIIIFVWDRICLSNLNLSLALISFLKHNSSKLSSSSSSNKMIAVGMNNHNKNNKYNLMLSLEHRL